MPTTLFALFVSGLFIQFGSIWCLWLFICTEFLVVVQTLLNTANDSAFCCYLFMHVFKLEQYTSEAQSGHHTHVNKVPCQESTAMRKGDGESNLQQ